MLTSAVSSTSMTPAPSQASSSAASSHAVAPSSLPLSSSSAICCVPCELSDIDDLIAIHRRSFGQTRDPLHLYMSRAEGADQSLRLRFEKAVSDPKRLTFKAIRTEPSANSSSSSSSESATSVIVGYMCLVPPDGQYSEEEEESMFPPSTEFLGRFLRHMSATRRREMGSKPFWYVSLLFSDPTAWGQGVGRCLINHAFKVDEDASTDQSSHYSGRCGRIYLESSPYAETFYKRMGFRELGRNALEWDQGDGLEGLDRLEWGHMLWEREAQAQA